MQIRHDPQVDAVYIKLSNKKINTSFEALRHRLIVDLDAEGAIIGLELLGILEAGADPKPEYIRLGQVSPGRRPPV
jgi:uncharacterized protein YuzE